MIGDIISGQPRPRSALRLMLGGIYFTAKRYWQWVFAKQQYARNADCSKLLPHHIASHHTPLIREFGKATMKLQFNKITNLSLAARQLDGLVVQPGETFSFWRRVGKPTRGKGYLEGMVLSNGEICAGIGGGLCQLSNLIYWMTLHTPLTVTERWRHNYDVFPDKGRTQPFASGATVVYNYVDLQITNNTGASYQLVIRLDHHNLYGEWRSTRPLALRYEIYEREHLIKAEWWGGYTRSNVLGRRIYDLNGHKIGDEFICANRAFMMYKPLLS